MPERVVFQTQDQVAVVGTLQPVLGAKFVALMLHMMPADRKSWESLQSALADRGIASLAIDLRGHGESTIQNAKRIHYRDFTDADHQGSFEDVRSALRWLGTRGFVIDHVILVGASIGANLALATAAEQPTVPAVVLLSPGESYRGIDTFGPAAKLTPSQALFAAASQGDDQESFDATVQIVARAASSEKTMKKFTASGHGTNLFTTHPDLVVDIADWIAERAR
jgi:pimeloyl-ACP methyl ester carboxylesterase